MHYFRLVILYVLISLSCSYIIMSWMIFTSPNEVMTGSDLIEEVIIAILLGITLSLLSFIFRSDMPFIAQLFLHFLSVIILVYTAGYFGNWYDVNNFSTVGIVFMLILIIYGGTWWVVQNLTQKDVKALNKSIEKKRGEMK